MPDPPITTRQELTDALDRVIDEHRDRMNLDPSGSVTHEQRAFRVFVVGTVESIVRDHRWLIPADVTPAKWVTAYISEATGLYPRRVRDYRAKAKRPGALVRLDHFEDLKRSIAELERRVQIAESAPPDRRDYELMAVLHRAIADMYRILTDG